MKITKPTDQPRFVVIGGFVADCIVNTNRIPHWGDDLEVDSVRLSPGGKALNQAVALARLGAHVTAVGAVGDDAPGREILAVLQREGVDVACIEVREGVATPICVCLVGADGETSFLWHIDEGVAVSPRNVDAATSKLECAGTALITFEMPLETVGYAIKAAKSHHMFVVAQPAPPLQNAVVGIPWHDIDVLVPNRVEALSLVGHNVTEQGPGLGLSTILSEQLGVASVVVTLGSKGCESHSSGRLTSLPAVSVEHVVDTTGASDAFTATLAFHLAASTPVDVAISAALAAASSAVSARGGYESMPYADPS